jgi:murein tripeptide amidase MpaA
MITVSQQFEGGNIEIIDATHNENIQLSIRKDTNAKYFQWFYFQALGVKDQACHYHIINAHESSYAQGWSNYHAVASYDQQEWFRVPTHYDGKSLIIKHTSLHNSIFYAFFAPYSWDRALQFFHRLQLSPLCEISEIGRSTQNKPMHCLKIGNDDMHKRRCWFIARQHCGETMASWFMEGFLLRLLDQGDSVSRALLDKAVFYIVPMMNPDGAVLGNLRANAVGIDLNRQWHNPSIEKSPEVFYVRQKMHDTGVDFFMDVHGDEVIPYNFFAGCEGNPNFSSRLQLLEKQFQQFLIETTPEFQTEHGYQKDQFGPENLTLATNYVGYTFDCLSFTLEMPFKDNNNMPDAIYGWSPARCKKLGYDMLTPLHRILPVLR